MLSCNSIQVIIATHKCYKRQKNKNILGVKCESTNYRSMDGPGSNCHRQTILWTCSWCLWIWFNCHLFEVRSCLYQTILNTKFTRQIGYSWNDPQSHLGPWLFWSQRNLDPKKFGLCMNIIILHFSAGAKLLGAKISQVPNFSGSKLLGDQKNQGPKWDRGQFQL